ncbi:MAG: hypothetical protein JRJ82_07920 [Deltaproteobacteria bacterium]|nr:hypothetical protein [Deltaproteobacteria bacterium]
MHREDFLKVDGYDEVFDRLWGREDSDICYRLFHSGVKIRNLWFTALQYHLYHEVIKRAGKDRLDEELINIRSEKRTRAKKGFSTLSSEGEIIADELRKNVIHYLRRSDAGYWMLDAGRRSRL